MSEAEIHLAGDRRRKLSHGVQEFAFSRGIHDHLSELITLTEEVFSGDVDVEVGSDPESPEGQFLIFHVQESGDLDAILAKENEWLKRTAELLPNHLDALRLAVDAEP